jgi:hypothetical protein
VPEASESDEEENIERMTSRPCDALVPNNDGHAKGYPLRFICADFEDGCIHYALTTGSCKTALRFPQVRKDRLVSCTLKKVGKSNVSNGCRLMDDLSQRGLKMQ